MENYIKYLFSRLTFDRNMISCNFDHHLDAFEKYTYGVISQYNRILDHNGLLEKEEFIQLQLDIHYYILCWDKLKKIFYEIKRKTSNFHGKVGPVFFEDFRQIRHRLDHLFSEIPTSIRNEYEHPSLKPHISGNSKSKIYISNTAFFEKNGDLSIHVGKDEFADVKKEHVESLQSCWAELSDLFFKHFSEKPLNNTGDANE